MSFQTSQPLLLLPIQKSAAVLGLENVLSEFITQLSFSKVAYSFINFSRFSFQLNEVTQFFARILPFKTVKERPSGRSICVFIYLCYTLFQ